MHNAPPHDQWLDLTYVLPLLLTQGRVHHECAEQAKIRSCEAIQKSAHPLVFLAGQQLSDPSRPGKTLDIETLTAWLAHQCHLPYLRIDPLKIDVATVTGLMSFAFAQRHKILVVATDEHTVTIACTQPWVRSWEADLKQVLKRPVRRVLANPEEIQRLTVEFYTLAKSVTGAALNDQKNPRHTHSEQLLTLSSSQQEPEANDAHIVNIVNWLFQYAFEQRASDIHIEPRREQGCMRFRIDGALHDVFRPRSCDPGF